MYNYVKNPVSHCFFKIDTIKFTRNDTNPERLIFVITMKF